MKVLLILWAIGLTTCEKLDRTYLPPPGSVTAGGHHGDLDLPLEYPKENYPSTLEPENYGANVDSSLKPNFPNVAFGIDRQGPTVSSAKSFATGPDAPATKNIFKVPTTTTSYAFTQTTTLSPAASYETTVGPVSTQGYPSITFSYDSNLNYPQQTDTDFVDTVPGSIQINEEENVGQLYTSIPYNTTDFQRNIQNIQQIPSIRNGLPKFKGQIPRVDKISQTTKGFFNTNYPSTQYGGDVDNISGVTIPTTSTTYPDNYYNEQNSATYTPNIVSQGDLQNQQYPGQQDNLGGINKFQDSYGPSNSLLPNQYTGRVTSPTGNIGSSSEYTSTPKYSSAIDNLGQTHNRRIRPERVQADTDRNAVILNYKNILTPESFAYSFDTSNGIHTDESGTAIDGVKAEGSYSYTGDDGKVYSVIYTADENGFLPRGDHLPTPPPIPDAILKVIEQASKNKQSGVIDDGSYDEAKYGHGRYQGLMDHRSQVQYNNIIGKLSANKGGNLNNGRKENALANIDKHLDGVYIRDDLNNISRHPYHSNLNEMNKNDQSLAVENETNQPNNADQLNVKGVSSSSKMQDDNYQFINKSLDKSIDNSQISEGKSEPFHPDYISNIPQIDKTTIANKFGQNNVALPANFDVFNPTAQVTNLPEGYSENENQASHAGYEYIHPQNAFIYNDGNNLKSRFSTPNEESDKTGPDNKIINGGSTSKPFMTPNVSFNFNGPKTVEIDNTLNSQTSIKNINRPVYTNPIYTQNRHNDFVQTEVPTFYNHESVKKDNEDIANTNEEFSTRKPEYGSTSSAPQNYEAPYTSKLIDSGRQRLSYPASTLGSRYASTTPLPSEISSQSTPSRVYYTQTTPTSQYTSTVRPSVAPEILSPYSGRPGAINEVRTSTTKPDFANRRTGYRNRPEPAYSSKGYKEPISQVGSSNDELKPSFGDSSPPTNFGSQAFTERVIGEDFSGPKQPQRFDPKHGYYY